MTELEVDNLLPHVLESIQSKKIGANRKAYLEILSDIFGVFVDFTYHDNNEEFFTEHYSSEALADKAKKSTAYRAQDPFVVFGYNNRLVSASDSRLIPQYIIPKIKEVLIKSEDSEANSLFKNTVLANLRTEKYVDPKPASKPKVKPTPKIDDLSIDDLL